MLSKNRLQVCCKDLWYLEVAPPSHAMKVALVRASTQQLELCWNATTFATAYELQIQKIDVLSSALKINPAVSTTNSLISSSTNVNIMGSASIHDLNKETSPAVSSIAAKYQKPTIPMISTSLTTSADSVVTAPSANSSTTMLPNLQTSNIAPTFFVAKSQPGIHHQKSQVSAKIINVSTHQTIVNVSRSNAVVSQAQLNILQKIRSNSSSTSNIGSIPNQSVVQFNTNSSISAAVSKSSNLRVVSTTSSSPAHVRLMSNSTGQTLRLATPQVSNTTSLPTTVVNAMQQASKTSSTTTIGGKQYIIQKPLTIGSKVQFQLVKTSMGGVAVQTVPKGNINLGNKPQNPQPQVHVALSSMRAGTALHVAGSDVQQTRPSQMLSGNLVKLVTPQVGVGNKLFVKNNIVQMGKMQTSGGKQTFVLTNKQGQQLSNQQIIIVSTGSAALRTLPAAGIVSSAGSQIVSIVSSTATTPSPSVPRTMLTAPSSGVKMIRGLSTTTGRPITLTIPTQQQQQPPIQPKLSAGQLLQQKTLTIGGKTVTVQVAGTNQPLMGIPKTVTLISSQNQQSSSSSNVVQGSTSGAQKVIMLPATSAGRKGLVNVFGSSGIKRTITLAPKTAPINNSANHNVTKQVQLNKSSVCSSPHDELMDDIIEQLDSIDDI